MIPLSIGKWRGLQQCSTAGGALAVLALDHRNNLRNALNPAAPDTVTDAELVQFKREVIGSLAGEASAVLLDVEYGAGQCIASGSLPGKTGLLIALEASGYTGNPAARESGVLKGWSAAKARRMGATAAKMLVYYHPGASTAGQIEALVKNVASDCAAEDLPLFVEPLSYPLDSSKKKLAPDERRAVVVETARRLALPGVDVIKAEFPLDIAAEPDARVWVEACAELTEASPVPWVLLSASVPYETFLRQVTAACQAGASGVAVGRAVWQESTSLAGEARMAFLQNTARIRMQRVTALCAALAQPWTQYFSAPAAAMRWYESY